MYGGLIPVSSSEQYVELLSALPSACSRQMFNAAAGDAAHFSHTSIHPFFKTKLLFQVFVEVLLALSDFFFVLTLLHRGACGLKQPSLHAQLHDAESGTAHASVSRPKGGLHLFPHHT